MSTPSRQVRAAHDATTVTVYQAYAPAIAEPAVAAGRLVPPFRAGRTTWVKPSFLWMMYRSGWATKPDQERVLSVRITREGFAWALAHAPLSHVDQAVHTSHEAWAQEQRVSPARVQWDPERDLHLRPLAHRSLQLGLGGDASRRYVEEWTVGITDVTALAHEVHALVLAGDLDGAARLVPDERPYGLAAATVRRLGASVQP